MTGIARALGAAALLFAPACVVEVDVWTPIGSDAGATGRWTIDGAPATAASCAAAGISSIEIAFRDPNDGLFVTPAEFVFDCSAGSFNLPTVLSAGTYQYRWRARRTTGGVEEAMELLTTSAPFGGIADFGTFVITTGGPPTFDPRGTDFSLRGRWIVNGGPSTAAACAAIGVDRVQLVVLRGADSWTDPTFTFPCAAGAFDSTAIGGGTRFAYGSYMTVWRALAADGTNVGMSMPAPLVVNAPTTSAELLTANFVLDIKSTDLILNLSYDLDPSMTMVDGNCAMAGVGRIYFRLTDVTNPASPVDVVDNTTTGGVACTEQLVFSAPQIQADRTYELFIEGETPAGAKQWMAFARDLVAPDFYNVALTRTAGP
jgi:hypothetical protein